MDKLAELPLGSHQLTSDEKDILNEYFPTESKEDTARGWVIIIPVLSFLIVCNPYTDKIFALIPTFADGGLTTMFVKLALFVIVFILLNRLI